MLAKVINNNIIKRTFFSFIVAIVFIFAFLYLKTDYIVFPCLNGILMLVSMFILKRKYRIYSVIYFSFFPSLLSIKKYNIPSFVSINIAIYAFCILIELIVLYKKKNKINLNQTIPFIIFVVYLLLLCCINIKSIDFFKSMSIICYLSLPILFSLDKKSEKNVQKLIYVFCIAIMLSNLYAFAFVYIFKSYSFQFLECFIPNYVIELKVKGYSNFRFPGLIGDSNHNSLNILLALTLTILYSIKYKKGRLFIIICSCLLQFFAFLGGSKTYIICLFLTIFGFAVFYFYQKKIMVIGISLTLLFLCLISLFFLNIGFVGMSISRLFNIDSRGGFLESITTGRYSVWQNYLVALSADPLSAIMGHCIASTKLYDFNFHSVWLEMFWDFGYIGTALFAFYFYNAFIKPLRRTSILVYFPFFVCLFFGFTLHILYDESIYFSLVISTLLSEFFIRKKKMTNIEFCLLEI